MQTNLQGMLAGDLRFLGADLQASVHQGRVLLQDGVQTPHLHRLLLRRERGEVHREPLVGSCQEVNSQKVVTFLCVN